MVTKIKNIVLEYKMNLLILVVLILFLLYYKMYIYKWNKSSSFSVSKYKIQKNKILKKYNKKAPSYIGLNNKDYIKKVYYKYLINWDFVPRMKFTKNYIIEDYYKHNLSKKNKPKDYKEQLLKIDQTIKQSKMYHNDYFLRHFFVKNEKIYLIDWNNFIDYVPKWAKDRNNINTIIDKLK